MFMLVPVSSDSPFSGAEAIRKQGIDVEIFVVEFDFLESWF